MPIDRRLAAHFDWTLFGLAMILSFVGILTIYSANFNTTEGEAGTLALKQFYWLLVSLVAMAVAFTVDYHRVDQLAYPFYVVVLGLLILVHSLGVAGGGSQRWLHFGYFAVQPSELAKLAIVLVLAKHLQYDEPPQGFRLRDLWLSFLFLAPLIIFILFQPDLGTAIVIGLVFLSILLLSGLRLRSFLYLTAAGALFLPIGWQFLKPYQQKRIWTFLNPNLDPLGEGYHVIQSKIAIGSGGWLGKGYLHGTQNRLDFLPAQHTDFVFSVFAEEWGFLGSLTLLGLFCALLILCLGVVVKAKDRLGAILALGMATILFWQATINLAMVTGLLPVVGIPLPFLSYGGSSLVTTMVAVGVIINVSTRRYIF